MLIERSFVIGGLLLLALSAILIASIAVGDAGPLEFNVALATAFLLFFGSFFIWVGREARAERRALLRAAEDGTLEYPR